MANRQKNAAITHAKFPLKLISVSAVALLIGIGAAVGQGGSTRQTEQNVEKQKDNELLTPIRPLPRKVGETSWPEPKPEAQREANDRKAAPVRETTGQSMSAQSNKADQPNNPVANNQANSAPQPAPTNQAASNQPQPAQNTQQQPATAQSNAKPQPQPAQTNQTAQQPQQNNIAQPQPNHTAPAPQPSQNTAQNAPAPNNVPPNQNAQQPAQQSNTQQAQNNSQPDHASIRLGTDASGKVAINDDQEQQLARALRKERPVEVNVGVQIGNPAPRGVRLAAVSADIAQVLPQFRGYAYFATAEQVYIVDAGADRVVAMVPVKLKATVKREAPSRTVVSSNPAAPTQPEAKAAPAHTATVPATPAHTATVTNTPAHTATVTTTPAHTSTVTTTPAPTSVTTASEPRSKRSTRRGDDLAGIEAAIEREVRRKGLDARGSVVVVEEAPAIQRVPTRRWRPWFAGDVQ
jgi:hypothetical protein